MIAEQPADPAAALDAPDLLDRLATNAAASGRAGSLMEIRMLQALALALLGRRAQAQEALREALTASPEPEAYVRLFLDEGEPLQALLRETVRSGDGTHHGAVATARHLLGLAAPSGEEPARLGEEPPAVIDPLSERELQVLRLLGTELSGPEIARVLFISQNTLRTHTKHIFTKLGVTSRRSAVALARRHGLA
ncbi:response regulator transcription factor [Pseudarthrobacter sp. NIBRBAC000502771]|uniref:response regulator transcription factor n=1 Tax=Pseudarthrobacter sp. NIBRBAC000502771 TaxID=2590774 RepID=UPI00143D99AA|nr:LuxR C-terminal-related transcriptional regulator [Pseudarthrobacter sp. NIBRBAC000502771]